MNASSSPVVSDDADLLILVDEDDQPLGTLDKASCHDGEGRLHRAFSAFVFDRDGRLLLQQRAAGKRLWPGYWSNSCCSHPRSGETLDDAARRRVREELGLDCELDSLFSFVYHARFGELGAEHEHCTVYVGRSAGTPAVNEHEISAWRWIEPTTLDAELADDPQGRRFTPWFQIEWARLRSQHAGLFAPA